MTQTQTANCTRCGALCKVAQTSNPEARLLRHSTVASGYCPDCAVADFLQNQSQLAQLMEINPVGKQMLLDPRVQQQFAGLLTTGQADAAPAEINWQRVYDNWELPFKGKKRRMHP